MSDPLKEEGLKLFQQGSHDAALAKFQAALEAYTADNDQTGRAEMFNNIGVIHRIYRNWGEAIAAFSQAETIFKTIGDDNRLGQVWGNLGDLYAFQGEREKSAGYYSDSAEAFARAKDHGRQSQVLRALSLLRLRQRRFVEAMRLMEMSQSILPQPNLLQRFWRALLRFALGLFGGTA